MQKEAPINCCVPYMVHTVIMMGPLSGYNKSGAHGNKSGNHDNKSGDYDNKLSLP